TLPHSRADRSRPSDAAAGLSGARGTLRARVVRRAGGRERRLRLARHGRDAGRGVPPPRRRRNALLDELRRTTSGSGAPLDGALRPRGHAPVPLTGALHRYFARPSTNPIAFVNAPTVNGFWSSGPSLGASTEALSLR